MKQKNARIGKPVAILIALVGIVIVALPFLYTAMESGMGTSKPEMEVFAENSYERTVRVVGMHTYEPYSFIDENGNPAGFEVELFNEIANRAGFNVEVRLLDWEDCVAAVESGDADVMMGRDVLYGMQDNNFVVSKPTCTDTVSIYGWANLDTPYALPAGSVGTTNDMKHAALLISPDSLLFYDSVQELMQAVNDGTLDYVLLRRAVAWRQFSTGRYSQLRDVMRNGEQYTSYVGYAVQRDNQALADEINAAIDALSGDGTVVKLQEKWFAELYNIFTLGELIDRDPGVYAAFGLALFVYLLSVAVLLWILDVRAHEREQAERLRRNDEVIKILSNDYTGLYHFNISRSEGSMISMSERIQHDTGASLAQAPSLQDALMTFIKTLVHPNDRAMLAEVADPEKIRERLMHKKRESIIFRRNYDGEYQYTEMTIAKAEDVDEPPVNIAVGFTEIDRQYKIDMERQAIIRGLTNDFTLVCCINPHTMEDQVYRLDESKLPYLRGWNKITNFIDRMQCLEEGIVHPDDCEQFYAATRKDRILNELKKAPAYTVNYRNFIDGVTEYWQIKFVMTDAEPFQLVAGFHSVDDEMRAQMKTKEVLERNLEIIDILASEYSSVYYIDLDTEEMTPYSMNADKQSRFGQTLVSGISYSDAFRMYVDELVCEADKADMLRAGSVYNIRRQLARQKAFITTYRSEDKNHTRFCEMKFVKVGGEFDEPKAVALGFANKDEEILKRYVDSKLYEDYIGLYFVNLESDIIRTLKWLQSDDTGKRRGTSSYSERLRDLSKNVMPEYREFWERMADISFVQKYLADDDRREYSYRSISGEWRRTALVVLERVGGVAVSFVLTFMPIDKETAQKIELDAKIAEQKRVLEQQQEALEQALQMANAASKAKTVFLNNMSHDIRTPMNAIIGFTGLISKHIDNREQVEDYVAKISQSSDHLLSLINDVLDMSRIESGKMNLEEKEESLSEIVRGLRSIVQANARAKQIDLLVDAVDVYDEHIICDKLRLNQILLNLMSNAIKYTNENGTVTLLVTEKKVSRSGYGTYEFSVRDNGIGMSETFLSTIFEPFARAQSETVNSVQGTGLGMAITKTLVDMMGGNIEVRSHENVGTEVIVTFEFKICNTPEPEEFADMSEFEGLRALVVNSNTDICRCVCKMLRDLGLRAEWCVSGKEAVLRTEDAVQAGDMYGVYFIGNEMTEMNGVATAEGIRRVAGTDARVILLKPTEAWIEVSPQAVIASVISQPIFPSDLRRVLCTSFGRSKVREEAPVRNECFNGKRILLVEDNEMNREIAVEILTDSEFVVDTAENGEIAVEKISQNPPGTYDIVLMDVQMPVMNGYAATKAIRALPDIGLSEIPIIAMTANAFEEDRRAALAAGMDAHLAKPISVDVLKRTLRHFV
ncbi:MAG: transporter substrate-binding domain-containing protein [Ruminococcaceae bacterium]|nr:transporter substrate-binding domain-containing protein [Oscillospiraceae bacterium]